MEILGTAADGASVTLTTRELTLVVNSLNEALNAVEEWEFPARVGGSVDQAQALLTALAGLVGSTSDAG